MGQDSEQDAGLPGTADSSDRADVTGVTDPTVRSKSAWRRFIEVAGPVAAFAVVAPFAVNGLATAVNNTAPADRTVAAAATADSPVTTAPIVTTPTTTVAPAPAADEGTPIEIEGVAADADDKTISLATEIVAVSPATETSAGPNASESTVESTPAPAAASGEGHAHGAVTPEVPLTRAERKNLAAELSIARDAAMKFATVADAEAAGYKLVTGYLPLIGAHYINWGLMEATFDPAAPEMLLYDGTDPDSSIVGLSYYLFSDVEPSPFTGANDHWHQHIGLCIRDGVVVGGSATTPEECTARGGAKAGAENGWMVHAWVVPGWDSPQGVFSPEHIGLTPDLPTS